MSNQKEFRMMLFNTWVNFQKNMSLTQYTLMMVYLVLSSGMGSFKKEDEYARFPNMKEDQIKAGHFAFIVSGQLGNIIQHDMCIDNTWEGKWLFSC